MKILLSAYACEPERGSEPGVGWQWALEMSKYYKVWVITRLNNKNKIEGYFKKNNIFNENLNFIYVDLAKPFTYLKKGNRGIRLYYYMWQKKAYNVAQYYHKQIGFDLVHHVTFVSYTQPTFMYKLNIPFVFGPVGGGENIPKIIGLKMNSKEKFLEGIRLLSQCYSKVSLAIIKVLKSADVVLATTDETKQKFPKEVQNKTDIFQAIGMSSVSEFRGKSLNSKIKILMVGRLIGWKGFDLGINSFKKLLQRYNSAELTIIGKGSLKSDLRRLSENHYNKDIFFIDDVEHKNIIDVYKEYDILLNTSLRDSGCMVVLEAMSAGLPVVCIDTGGPSILTSKDNSIKIHPQSYKDLVNEIEEALYKLCINEEIRDAMGKASIERVKKEFLFSEKGKIMNEYYLKAIEQFKNKKD